MSYRPADADQRELALDLTQSFCVQAPAGSGKTELLTQRLLKLLAHVEEPEEILAFTFTRKAAAVMRARVLDGLYEAQRLLAGPAAARDSLEQHKRRTFDLAAAVLAQNENRGWQLLQNSQRLRLNTIDSFTSWLSAQLPLSSRLGARAVITTDMETVFAEAIHDTLAMLDTPGPTGSALRLLLPHLQNKLQDAEKLLQTLLDKRDQWLAPVLEVAADPSRARTLMEEALRDLVDTQLQQAAALLAPFTAELLDLITFASEHLLDHEEHPVHLLAATPALPAAEATALPAWRALTRFLLVNTLESFRKRLTGAEGFPGQKEAANKPEAEAFAARKEAFTTLCGSLEAAGCLPALQMVARLPDPHYSASQWQVLDALCVLLPALAAQLDVTMQGEGVVDHTETSLAALRALGNEDAPTDLALRLDYRIHHILVDEFQDTSSLQFRLLEKLTHGWQQGDGRTLFIVGDGMQSCYAFRNAKVGLFLKARDEGIGTVKPVALDLRTNFRSDNSVVEWVNTVFSESFPRIDDIPRGGVRYSPSEARSPAALTPGVHCHFFVDRENQSTDSTTRRQLEADCIAQLCKRLQEEDPQQRIAVLVRGRSHLAELVPALRALGLRWNASKIDKLLSYPDVNDLFTLLRALLSVADVTAWLALLRTPFIGLALADLNALAGYCKERKQSLWSSLQQHEALPALSDDARARLRRCVPLLLEARQRRQQLPLRQVLEALWIALGGPACLSDSALLGNITSFLALVDQHVQAGDIADIHALEEALAQTFGSAVDATVNLELMTIHNAKGLEFDVVLVPGLDRVTRANSKDLLLWKEHLDSRNHSRLLLGLLPGKGHPDDPLYDYLRFEEDQRDALEATRLLYIAVTRAARSAWLFGCLKTGKGKLKAPASSLLQHILPVLQAAPGTLQVTLEPLPAPIMVDTGHSFPRLATQPLRRLPRNWQQGTALLLPARKEAVVDAPLHENLLARSIGDLVHLGLKRCVEYGRDWLDAAACPPLWTRTLAPLCGTAAELSAALATVRAQVSQCLHAPDLAWLFVGGLRDDACELALADYSTGKRRNHVIDRTFIDKEGVRWIVDYKSSRPPAGQTLDTFLQEQAGRYRRQLQDYAALFRGQAPVVRMALLFTAVPTLFELH